MKTEKHTQYGITRVENIKYEEMESNAKFWLVEFEAGEYDYWWSQADQYKAEHVLDIKQSTISTKLTD